MAQRRPPIRDVVFFNTPPSTMVIPPVGIGYLAEHLRARGYAAPVVDMNIEMYKVAGPRERRAWELDRKNIWLDQGTLDELLHSYREPVERCLERVLSLEDHLIGFTVLHSRELIVTEMIRRIRQAAPERRIVLGGPLFSGPGLRHNFSVHCDYDWAVVGEGEIALELLLRWLGEERGDPPSGAVPGAYMRKEILGPEPPKTPHPPIVPLDQLPWPRYGDLAAGDYLHSDPFPVVWSRGCPGRCAFCESWRIWGRFRGRTPEHIHAELEHITREFGHRHVAVFDAVINANLEYLEGVADRITSRGPSIEWEGNFIASSHMTEQLYAKLHRSGCRRVYFGLESGSPKVMQLMKKPFSLETVERNVRMAHEQGIDPYVNIITGFPGEGEREFEESMEFLRRNSDALAGVEFITECQIPEGTDLMLHPERYGVVMPEDFQGFRWHTEDGTNTLEVRQQRSRIMHEECVKLGLQTMPSTTLTDGTVPSLDD